MIEDSFYYKVGGDIITASLSLIASNTTPKINTELHVHVVKGY